MNTEVLSNVQALSLLSRLSYEAGCSLGVTNVEFRNGARERSALPPMRAKGENVTAKAQADWVMQIDRMFDLATNVVWFEKDDNSTIYHNLTFRADGYWVHEYEVVE